MYELAPSILAADFSKLGEDIKTVSNAGAKWLHFDVMDGNFVPSISFGMPVLVAVRKNCDLFLDVHLMIANPDAYIAEFAACGADMITVHAETCPHLDRTIASIHEAGCKAGVALNPGTSLNVLEYVLDSVDMVLIMTVNPGFGGQKYIPYCTEKIRKLRNEITKRNLSVDIEVDGGISLDTLEMVIDAGANILVAGSAVFGQDAERKARTMIHMMNHYAGNKNN